MGYRQADRPAGGGIPEANRPVPAARQESAAIATERHDVDRGLWMPEGRPDAAAICEVPELDRRAVLDE